VLALRPHTRSILGAAGHMVLTSANLLLVMGQIIWSLSNLGFEPATFQSLAQRANQLCYLGPRELEMDKTNTSE
jgi:hypothetical protein